MPKPFLPDVLDYFRKQGAKGGKIGGKRAAASMTPAQRSARARKASLAAAKVRTANAAARKKGKG